MFEHEYCLGYMTYVKYIGLKIDSPIVCPFIVESESAEKWNKGFDAARSDLHEALTYPNDSAGDDH